MEAYPQPVMSASNGTECSLAITGTDFMSQTGATGYYPLGKRTLRASKIRVSSVCPELKNKLTVLD